MADDTCTVEGCDRPLKSRVYCNPHTTRLYQYGDVLADKPIKPRSSKAEIPESCIADGCDRKPKSRKLCAKHYDRWTRRGSWDDWQDPGCSIDGCERSHYGGPGKWCRVHYRRWKTHGDPHTVLQPSQRMPRPSEPCSIAGCARRRRYRNGLCQGHYAIPFTRRWGRAWRKANPDKVKATYHRRRAAKKDAPVNDLTAQQWIGIKAAYRWCCAYCHRKRPLTMDHVIPLSRGGPHTASNIVPACRSCNSRKGARAAPAYQPLLF